MMTQKAPKGKGGKKHADADNFSWNEHIPGTLNLLVKLLKIKTHRIWIATADRDTFIK